MVITCSESPSRIISCKPRSRLSFTTCSCCQRFSGHRFLWFFFNFLIYKLFVLFNLLAVCNQINYVLFCWWNKHSKVDLDQFNVNDLLLYKVREQLSSWGGEKTRFEKGSYSVKSLQNGELLSHRAAIVIVGHLVLDVLLLRFRPSNLYGWNDRGNRKLHPRL